VVSRTEPDKILGGGGEKSPAALLAAAVLPAARELAAA
jgi:hypothetical protein